MKTICERCHTSLDNASAATICSYECPSASTVRRRWTASARTVVAS
ncbi:DUF1272 domain-containing protein [Rhodococcus erythropolis]|nr:DUF1272 domain-containing protein [Rhodococcus erythropolis]MDV6272354.1 DUF1272 domain-containing protein [Rhodococcus erythropolis]